jgi:hypothetical protein
MKIDMGVVLKAGLVGAAIGVALVFIGNLLSGTLLFLVSCVICVVTPGIGVVSGLLYGYFSDGAGEMTDAAVGGALAGVISSLASGVVNIIWGFLSGSGDVFQSAGGILGGALLGAIGAVIFRALKKK